MELVKELHDQQIYFLVGRFILLLVVVLLDVTPLRVVLVIHRELPHLSLSRYLYGFVHDVLHDQNEYIYH